MRITPEVLRAVAPRAHPVVAKQIIQNLQGWAAGFGLGSDDEVLQFLAQLLHESSGLTDFEENLSYSTSKRIAQVWPSRFTEVSARPFVRNPKGLANKVYANRMGNGSEASGDGYKFRGRSGLQATGRAMYQKVSELLKFDFVNNPDALADPKWVLPGSLAIARILKLGEVHSFRDDTKRLNGGYNGLADRTATYNKLRALTSA